MNFDYQLKVKKDEMYKFLITNFCNDMNINNIQIGEEINYKNNTQKYSYTVSVEKLEENKRFTLKYQTNLGINIIDYQIIERNEEDIILNYREDYQTDSILYKANYWIVSIFWQWLFKHRRRKMFKQIESYIIKERKNVTVSS